MIKISVYNADSLIQEFESAEDKEITVGRAQGCSLRLDEASISRLHAVIFPLGGGWVLQRKANFGAVLLNEQEVENAPLEGGEEIKIGNFSLRIEITEAQPTALTGSRPVVTSSRNLVTTAGGGGDSEDGRTKFVTAGVSALFRMEPGSGNLDEFLMEKDVALFGRGSNCDVVLTEKKASRKHFEVRRQGLSFFLKDLNSANGTLVNGVAVTEAELVAGDHIQVGESKIQFSIENKEFFAKQDQFLPVPAHLQQASAGPDMGALGMPGDGASVQEYGPDGQPIAPAPSGEEIGPDGTPLPPKPNSNTDFIGHAKYKWAKIPKAQRMRYLAIFVVGSLVMAMLGGPDEEKVKVVKKPPVAGQIRRFEDLTPKNQAFVREQYKALLGAQEKKDYQTMFERSRNILSLVDEYNDTKSYESIAKRGLDAIEEEKKRKALEEKQAAIRREVAALEEKGQAIFERALVDAKARPDLVAMTKEIYVKDPNNRKAQEWLAKVKEKEEEEKREAEMARAKEELRQKAEDAYEAVNKIYQAKKYIEAIKASEGLADVGWTEQAYLDKVDKLKSDIRTELKSVLDPLLREAQNQRQDGGDLVKAKEMYLEVLKVDGANQEARMGLDTIRETLHLRAKRFYAEAILAESVSELIEARDKYEKCLHTAPEEDIYRKRCRGKLLRFEAFTPEASGKN